jgi:hypothetical protein
VAGDGVVVGDGDVVGVVGVGVDVVVDVSVNELAC